MQLTERIWLVGGGALGFGLTNALDCHVYLVDCGTSAVLIDGGAGIEPERIVAEIAATGIEPERVSHLLLTHGHADHSGGAAYLRRRLGCRVVASPEVAGFLQSGDSAAIALDLAKEAGIYPPDYTWQPCAEVLALGDSQALRVGEMAFTAVDTPGHASGHLSFLLPTDRGLVLFAGDAVFHGGAILLQAIPDCSIWRYRETIRRLSLLSIDILLPGHGALTLRDGQAHIERAEEAFRTLLPPRNLA